MNGINIKVLSAALFLLLPSGIYAQRTDVLLEKGWSFIKGDVEGAHEICLDDSKWDKVTVPHDWAIYGPFDINNDLQTVAVTQNFETKASLANWALVRSMKLSLLAISLRMRSISCSMSIKPFNGMFNVDSP